MQRCCAKGALLLRVSAHVCMTEQTGMHSWNTLPVTANRSCIPLSCSVCYGYRKADRCIPISFLFYSSVSLHISISAKTNTLIIDPIIPPNKNVRTCIIISSINSFQSPRLSCPAIFHDILKVTHSMWSYRY